MYLFRQSGRNRWQVRWKQAGKRREVSTGTDDRLQAERVLLALREGVERQAGARRVEELLRSVFPDRRTRAVALDAAADLYRGQVEATGHTRRVLLYWARFAAWCLAHRPGVADLQDVDAAVCRAYAAALGGSPKTVANRVRDCARLWRVVAPLAGIGTDPWRGIRLSTAPEHPGRPLTPAECEALLSATQGTEYGGALLVGPYTGLRYGDVAHLRWTDLDGDTLCLQPRKTRAHAIRVAIPLHRRLAEYLAGLPHQGEYVFPALAESYGRRGTARRFMQACRAAGVPHAGITYQSLRHIFISRLAELGVPEDVRRRLAGHSSAATHDRYSHTPRRSGRRWVGCRKRRHRRVYRAAGTAVLAAQGTQRLDCVRPHAADDGDAALVRRDGRPAAAGDVVRGHLQQPPAGLPAGRGGGGLRPRQLSTRPPRPGRD